MKTLVSAISSLALLINSLSLPLYVYAQEETTTPSPDATPIAEETVSPTPEPTAVPTEEPSPSPEASATPEATIAPEETATPVPTAEEVLSTETTNESAQPQAPPSESPSPTPTISPVQPVEEGSLSATIVQEGESYPITVQNYNGYTVTTDKLDYAPTDTAIITGTNFTPGETYILTVSSNDAPATSTTVSVTADENGAFVYAYQLDGIYRPNYKVEVKDLSGDVIASTTFTDVALAITLYTDVSHTSEGYQFALGNTVYAQASGLSTSKGYKFDVKNLDGTVIAGTTTSCITGDSIPGNTYVTTAVSDNRNYTYELHEWTNSDCSGSESGGFPKTKTFNVAKATIYSDSSLSTLKNYFGSGTTAYVVISGLYQNKSNWDTTWVKPDLSTSCTNTGGNDRPDSTSGGAMPDAAPAYLEYPPATGSNNWNDPTKYNGACSAFSSGNQGQWKLTLNYDGTHFVTLSVFSVDTTAPTDPADVASTSHEVSVASPDNTIDMAWTAAGAAPGATDIGGTGVDGYSYEFSNSDSTTPDAVKDAEETVTGTTSAELADGTWYFHLRTVDNAGNWTATVHAGPYIISTDTTEPSTSYTSTPSSPTNDNTLIYGGTSTDDSSGIANVEYRATNNDTSAIEIDWTATDPLDGAFDNELSEDFTFTTSALPDAEYTIETRATDAAGNIESTASHVVLVDTTNPTSGIISPEEGVTYSDATWPGISGTADDASLGISTSGVSTVYVSIQRDSDGAYWCDVNACGESYGWYPEEEGETLNEAEFDDPDWTYSEIGSSDLDPGGGSEGYTVRSHAKDNAGNQENTNEVHFYINNDVTPPTSTIDSPEDNFTTNSPIEISGSSSDDSGDTVDYVRLYYRESVNEGEENPWTEIDTDSESEGTQPINNTLGSEPFNWNFTWTPEEDGTYDIKAEATDTAGNTESSPQVNDVTYDTTNPTGSWTTPTDGSTISGNVNLQASADDSLSGVASVEFQYKRNDGVDAFHSIATDTSSLYSTSWDTSSLALDDYTLRIIVTDNAGNTNTVDITVSVSATISNEGESSSTYGTATITWTTSQPTKSRVIYDTVSHSSLGAAPNYGYAFSTGTTDTAPKVTNHSVTLTGLSNGTTYYYRTVSEGSPVAVSNENSFQTLSTAGAGAPAGGGAAVLGVATVSPTAFFAPLARFMAPEEVLATEVEATPTPTPTPAPTAMPEVKGTKGGNRDWLWWFLLLVPLGLGYYYYTRRPR